MTSEPFKHNGAIIGILGTGQLGRMLCDAAHRAGYQTHVFGPEKKAPAHHVSDEITIADYSDTQALRAFGESVDFITLEFENIPDEAITILNQYKTVHPNLHTLKTAQHRLREKQAFADLDIPTTPYTPIHTAEDLFQGMIKLSNPCILKTCELGYDGKGQWTLETPFQNRDEAATYLAKITSNATTSYDFILEAKQPLQSECSVIIARNATNETVALGPFENHHTNGILDWSRYPAKNLSTNLQHQAIAYATQLARSLEVVGLLCVEFFVVNDAQGNPTLMANEMAPRPHNSGHLTQSWGPSSLNIKNMGDTGKETDSIKNDTKVSQFDWHVAAITRPTFPKEWIDRLEKNNMAGGMVNLLGDCWFPENSKSAIEPDWAQLEQYENIQLHLYGKTEARRGRKMGHINWTNGSGSGETTDSTNPDTMIEALKKSRQSVQNPLSSPVV